ncbi:MAG: hypothetical protein ACR2NI_00990 [Pirellulales bacterium]
MSASRVATAVTMNAEDIKFGVKQANDSLKKFVSVSKQADNSLKTLKFISVWRAAFDTIGFVMKTVTGTFNKLVRAISNPIAELPFVNAMKSFIDKTVEAAEVQRNLAISLGISMEQFAGLRLAAETTGISLTQLYEPISKLPRKIDDALRGLSDALTTFQRLPGINLDELGSKKPFEQFTTVIDAINKMPNIGERFAVINKIFEESGLKFRQFFATGSSGLKELINLAKQLDIIPSEDDLAKIRAVKKEMIIIGQQWEAIARDVLIEISPELIAFLKTVRDYLSDPKFKENLVTTIKDAFLNFAKGFMKFIDAVIKIADILGGLYDWFMRENKVEKQVNKATGVAVAGIGAGGFAPIVLPAKLALNKTEKVEATAEQSLAKGVGGLLDFFTGSEFSGKLEDNKKMVQKAIDEQRAVLKNAQDLGGEAARVAGAAGKFIDKITYTVASNAASGSAPGKLSAADATTQAGVELMLKSIDDGYKETKEVTMLKKIEKVLQKIEKKADAPAVNLQGAA